MKRSMRANPTPDSKTLVFWRLLASSIVFVTVVLLSQFCLMAQSADASLALKQANQEEDPNDPGEVGTDEKIQKLIKQLGSPLFAERQSATEQIWTLGAKAKKPLERAVLQGDPEVAKRASEMLTVLEMGIDVGTNPELAQLIVRFSGSEKIVRQEILSDLLRNEKVPLVFELLSQVKSEEDQAWLYNVVIRLNDTTMTYGRAERWADIEFMHRHPLTFKHEPRSAVQFHMALGTLESLVEQLKASIATAEKDGKKIKREDIVRLISIFRMERRFDEADEYIEKIKSDEFKNAMFNQLLFEKGDWPAIAKKMETPETPANSKNGLIHVTDSQRAFISKIINDEAGYQAVIQKYEEKIEEAVKSKDKDAERSARDLIIEVALVNLDWEIAAKHFDRKNVAATFRLLISNRRYSEALELVDVGETVERRDLWFNRKMKYIKTLVAKQKRLQAADKDTDETDAKTQNQWEVCLGKTGVESGVANILASLGLVDEAVAHYHTMFTHLNSDMVKRPYIVGRLIWLERYDEARELIKKGFTPVEQTRLVRNVFPSHKSLIASFWYSKLAARYPNPFKRLMATAGMINSPLGNIPDFDLEFELASIRADSKIVKSGVWDYQVALMYEFHGMTDKYESHMQLARQRGYVKARLSLVRDAVAAGDSDAVLEYYDSEAQINSSLGALMAADAHRQKGDLTTAAVRKTLAFAYWQDSYRNTGTQSSLAALKKEHLASDFLKLQVFQFDSSDDKTVSEERYRAQLAKSQMESNPDAAVINSQMNLYQHFNTDDPGEQNGRHWIELMIKANVAMARSAIAKGEFKKAADLLIKCDKFSPGDLSLGEKLIGELDEAGGTGDADRLFEQLSGFYFEILQQYPDSALHHNNYAWLCVSAKRRTKHMLRHTEFAANLRPNSSNYLDTLATVYFALGDKEKAIEFCRRSIQINPSKQHYREQLKRFLAE